MANERLLVNLIAFPINVLGPGKRIGIWTQGCSIRCKGCMSQHTWDFDETKQLSIDEIINRLQTYPSKKITLSGGEPLDQKDMLVFLATLREKGYNDILLYSGYEKEKIYAEYAEILKYIDVLVCGSFQEGLDTDKLYKGSKNQEMIIINHDLKEKYLNYKKKIKDKKMQRFGDIIVGIPYQRDLKAFNVM